MINKTIEEKKKVFFDIQEHPDRYSDQQIEEILADEELKATIHDAARIKRAIKKLNPQKVNVDDAWQQFSKTHIRHQHNWMKMTTSFWKVIMSYSTV